MTPKPTAKPPKPFGYVVFPATVVIDTREQTPYLFQSIASDHQAGGGPLTVPLVRAGLKSGDYSLEGHGESGVAVERKSVSDAVNTFTHGRKRFVRELERLAAFDAALVVIEGDWQDIAAETRAFGRRVTLRSLVASVVAWQQQFRGVSWMMTPDRRFAELYAFRFLERYWRNRQR